MFTISPQSINCYQFPNDATVGQQNFLAFFTDPNETWLRAYGFTMQDLVDDIIAAAQKGTAYHIFLDLTESLTKTEKPLVQQLAQAFEPIEACDLTIGTSQAGRRYIMHQKGFATSNADCWEGSINFSASGWLQVNSAMQFNDSTWRDQFKLSFYEDQAYAWDKERSYQVMTRPPANLPQK